MSKAKKLAEKFLKMLSTNKGRHIPTCSPLTKKDRRHSGHKIIYSDDEDYPTQFDVYDDWSNYRDSFRDVYTDDNRIKKVNRKGSWRFGETMKIQRNNLKIKRREKLRKAKKMKMRLKASLKKLNITEN